MQFPKSLFLAMAAGTVLPAVAFAQQADQIVEVAEPITINQIQGGGYARGGYAGRADLEVYQIGTTTETGGVFATSGTNVYDDVVFGGPYTSNADPLNINGMGIGFILPAVLPPVNGDQLYTLITFYPNHDNTIPDPASPYSGESTVTALLNWGAGWATGATPNSIRYYATSVPFTNVFATLTNADVFDGGPDDRTAGVKIETYHDAALTIRATEWQVARRAGFAGWKVGSSDTYSWFSSAATVDSGELLQSERSGGGELAPSVVPNVNQGNCRATYMGFLATGFVIAPPSPIDLGTLADGDTVVTPVAYSGNQVRWYQFTINGDAVDGFNTYIDIDNEGATGDFSIALYDGNAVSATYGEVVEFDNDSGSGTNAQLSFGMGRRPAVGDGRQYDGRGAYNGVAGLPAGTYFIAVAPNGSTFANGFTVTPGTLPAPATSGLKIRTNVNGTPIEPSVPPIINPGDDLEPNPLVVPGAQIALQGMEAGTPRWIRFTTCVPADDANPITLDWSGSNVAGGASATIFDVNGNLVTQVIYTGTGTPPPTVFNSGNPLPAGTYYMALYYSGIQIQPNNPNFDGRWHVRGTTQNNGFDFGGALFVLNEGCAPTCGTADFDGDGDVGTDADIEAFFACLAGICCDTCFPGGSDFNMDGDAGTDADIESFFRVLSGGPC
jgi:hypothetical protein